MGIRAGRRTGEGRLRRLETVLIACDLIKSNSSEMTAAKLATCLLIRGGISKEAKGVRCRTAPGSLENPRLVRLTLAQCSNTPALTPHCLAPEANSVKRERKVGVKSRLLRRTGSKRPFIFFFGGGGSDGRRRKAAGRRQSISSTLPGVIFWAVLGWIHRDTCREARKRFALRCGVLEMLKAARAGRAHGILRPGFG